MKIIAGQIAVIAFLCGCAALNDDIYVRESMNPSEQTLEFIDTCSLAKDQIYDRTLSWLTQLYNSANSAIDIKDREAGLFAVKGIVDIPQGPFNYLSPCAYTMQIRIKDSKTKMVLTVGKMQTETGLYPPKNSMEQIYSHFKSIHNSFVTMLSNNTKADDF